jgi:hypothetical protein
MLRHFVDDVTQGECRDTPTSCWDTGWVNRLRVVHATEEVHDRELPDTCGVLSGSSC